MSYIIDFDRINELCASHPSDKEGTYGTVAAYSITKNLIKRYLEVYENRHAKRNRLSTDDEIQEAIDTLTYNKILITRADIRDQKIDKVLE